VMASGGTDNETKAVQNEVVSLIQSIRFID
jgi:hypothetical protein